MSCQLPTRFRHITSLFLATFVWTPVWQTSAAKWLPRFILKGILSTMFSESIVKKFRAVFLKNITSNLVVSCQLLTRFRHITSLFLATFVWTPVCQTSAAKWLPRLIWKGLLSTMFSESIVKTFRAVFEKYNIKRSCVMSASDQISPYHIFIFATFVWTPVCQTSAAKWLPRLIWKGLLSTMFSESIVKKFLTVFEKYNINLSCVMSASDQISPYHIFISRYVCSAAKWLPRLIWKEILSTLCRVSIVRKFWAVF